jgi:hypothetical protein
MYALATLQQFLEALDGHARIPDDSAHRICIHGIMPGNGEEYICVCHHDVLRALADDPETGLLKARALTARRCGIPGSLGNRLNRNFDFAQQAFAGSFADRSQIFPDRVLNVLQGFLFGSPLRPAAGQPGA